MLLAAVAPLNVRAGTVSANGLCMETQRIIMRRFQALTRRLTWPAVERPSSPGVAGQMAVLCHSGM
jgi:hypothetical protein